MPKLIVEAIGTFFLMLTIGLVATDPGGAGPMAPVAIGSVLMVMVYAGGHVSGAHYNPAVTLGVFIRRRATARELGGYWVAQFAAGAIAAFTVPMLKGEVVVNELTLAVGPMLLGEFLFTFALVFVILNVATARATEGNSYYGLAIGFTVLAGAYAVGPVSGAAFNPAVALGIALLGVVSFGSLWIYLVANVLGGVAAALVFNAFDLGGDRAG